MNIDLGKRIKTLRLSHAMTQEQLAQKLGVSAQTVEKPCHCEPVRTLVVAPKRSAEVPLGCNPFSKMLVFTLNLSRFINF